ncbi:MAG: hypothetical protein NXI15_06430 [Gammaproteobacteria bacterium]|nr:hypothetical protein [Gammaproteobacteria bacterium]
MKINRDWFLKNSMFIPGTGLTATGYWEIFRELNDEDFSKLHEELRNAEDEGFEQAFVSWEGINSYSSEQIATLKRQLSDYQVKIYIYLREQSEVIQSGYFQQVKTGEHRHQLSEFFQNNDLLCPELRDYAALLGRFATEFGRNALKVRVFDRTLLKSNNVVVDMLDMLMLKPDSEFQLSPGEENISLDLASVKVMNLLDEYSENGFWQLESIKHRTHWRSFINRVNRLFPLSHSGLLHKKASKLLGLHYGKGAEGRKIVVDTLLNIIEVEGSIGKYFLSDDECKIIRDFYAESNRRVVEEFLDESWAYPELFPYNKQRTNSLIDTVVNDAVLSRLDTIIATGSYRTWNGLPLKGESLGCIASTEEGWASPSESGVKTNEICSTLKFRVERNYINFTHKKLILIVNGQSSENYNGTHVSINGQSAGVHNLKRAKIPIPLTSVTPLGLVDVRMEHIYETDKRTKDETHITASASYTLTSINYAKSS